MSYLLTSDECESFCNPFSKITRDVMEKYQGQTLAISLDSGDILYAGHAVDVLQHKMRTSYPGIKYARLTLP